MSWIYIAIASYFFTAIANILDKFLLIRFLKAAAIYAFYVGILGVLAVVLIPFGVTWPGIVQFIFSIVVGIGFIIALYLMYTGFLRGETTRVATLIGGSLPIFTFIFSYFLIDERLSLNQIFAFVFLVLGMLVISYQGKWFNGKRSLSQQTSYIPTALLSGLVFSLTFVGTKFVFESQEGFVSPFFWMRIGSFIGALLIIVNPKFFKQIKDDFQAPQKEQVKSKSMVLLNQIIGATGFILLNLAIDLSPSVSLVNAMQGLQYVFIFIIVAILGKKIKEIREEYDYKILFQKTLATILIVTGLIFLSF